MVKVVAHLNVFQGLSTKMKACLQKNSSHGSTLLAASRYSTCNRGIMLEKYGSRAGAIEAMAQIGFMAIMYDFPEIPHPATRAAFRNTPGIEIAQSSCRRQPYAALRQAVIFGAFCCGIGSHSLSMSLRRDPATVISALYQAAAAYNRRDRAQTRKTALMIKAFESIGSSLEVEMNAEANARRIVQRYAYRFSR